MAETSSIKVFTRTCSAEWLRLRSVKATWWFLGIAAVMMVGLGTLAGFDASGQPEPPVGEPAWLAAEISSIPAQFAFLALALMAVTADYATGGIVPTLQWTTRRTTLFASRAFVAIGAATIAGVVIAMLASLAAYLASGPILGVPFRDGARVLGTVAFVFGSGTALAVGLGFLLRNTAGALVSVFPLLLVLPAILPQFGYDWLTSIADALPGVGALFLLTGEPSDRGIDNVQSVITMLSWSLGALFLGWMRLKRDDANR